MSRTALKLVLLTIIVIVGAFVGQPAKTPAGGGAPVTTNEAAPVTKSGGSARQTWGRMETLADHFARHGGDFHARDAEDYAAQAAALLQRARKDGLPAKRDSDGSIRVFDPATGAFGAFNANGTTKTFFKPGPGYFDRQPGKPVDLSTSP